MPNRKYLGTEVGLNFSFNLFLNELNDDELRIMLSRLCEADIADGINDLENISFRRAIVT